MKIKRKFIIVSIFIFIIFIGFYFFKYNLSNTTIYSDRYFYNGSPNYKNILINSNKVNTNQYKLAKINIPKIKLNKFLYDIDNKYNNINYNIEIHKSSDMPNVIGGNLILQAHSGNNYNSFFKDLYKLNINDEVLITYNGYSYQYVIDDIYEIEKNGIASIKRDYSKSTITLITCTKDKNNKQTIYIGYLEKKECLF